MHFQPGPGQVGSLSRPVTLGLMVLAASLSGCGSSTHVVPLTPAEKALTNVALAYMDAHAELGHGPKNADDLKPFLKRFGNPAELLVSPNDGEPFVVIWGVNPTGGPTEYKGMFPILAYERKGSGGKRAVTDVRGRPMTIPAEDFNKLKFVGRHRPDVE